MRSRSLAKASAEEEAAAAAPENPLIAALLERSEANKALNDKKRLATSYANLARSRTVTDGASARARCAPPPPHAATRGRSCSATRPPPKRTSPHPGARTHSRTCFRLAESHGAPLTPPCLLPPPGTCAFPDNLIGCENMAEMGGVKWISDDLALECEGVPEGEICASKVGGVRACARARVRERATSAHARAFLDVSCEAKPSQCTPAPPPPSPPYVLADSSMLPTPTPPPHTIAAALLYVRA